jgi:uncharacterized coiled-coil DUF342 family protein
MPKKYLSLEDAVAKIEQLQKELWTMRQRVAALEAISKSHHSALLAFTNGALQGRSHIEKAEQKIVLRKTRVDGE